MAVRKPKILGFFTYTGVSFTAELTGGSGPQTVNLTSGDFFPSGEGALDLGDGIYRLELDIGTTDVDLANINVSISSDGFVTMTAGAAETITITWSGAETFRDWLGYTGATTVVTDAGITATNIVDLAYWSPFGTQIDEPRDRWIGTFSKSLSGEVYAVTHGEHQFIDMGLRFPGHWRNSVDGKYAALRNLWRFHMLPRHRARYYIDASANGAYDADSNAYGFHVVKLAEGEDEWNVEATNRQNRVRYEGSWRLAIVPS